MAFADSAFVVTWANFMCSCRVQILLNIIAKLLLIVISAE